MKHALKEWAVVCNALATGRQSLLLRAGGIAEKGFRVAHRRFWLFPTYFHEHRSGVRPEELAHLEEAEMHRPRNGRVVLTLWGEIAAEYQVADLAKVERLADHHIWSPEEIAKRFAYRSPGLVVLAVRMYRVPLPYDIEDTTEYQGCRSWVELEDELDTAGSTPVMADRDFQAVLDTLARAVGDTPTS